MELELLKYVVGHFAEHKEQVEYKVEEKERSVEITIFLAADDMGKVIGKQGKVVKALRTLLNACEPKNGKRYFLEIKERV